LGKDKKTNEKNDTTDDGLLDVKQVIDNILAKHKIKMDELQAKKTDLKKLSLKDRDGKTLYYLRKTPKKKTKDDFNFEELSEKIITEAKSNLGVEPNNTVEKTEETEIDTGNKQIKEHKQPGKIDKDPIDSSLDDIPKSKDILESKEFDEIVAKIDNLLKDKNYEKPGEENITTGDKKEEKDLKIDQSANIVSDKETKASKETETKVEKEEDKKDVDFISSSTDDLAGMKKKYEEAMDFIDNGVEVPNNEINKDESDLLDEKIKTKSVETGLDEKKDVGHDKAFELAQLHFKKEKFSNKEEPKKEEKPEAPVQKRSFFKKKKPAPIKETVEDKKEADVFDKPESDVESFPEANLSDADESKLLDDQIGKTSLTKDVVESRYF